MNEWFQDELGELFHWSKQALAVGAGLVCGLFGIQGWTGFLLFGALLLTLSNFAYRALEVADDVIDAWEAIQEASMPATFAFVVSPKHPSLAPASVAVVAAATAGSSVGSGNRGNRGRRTFPSAADRLARSTTYGYAARM
eukprot:GHVU01169867.1.p3 GENE.GHVU01169867.1~~GHVU01169867.1.p3  ORF type:complete len:140 (+),score=23.68 GHVU01169867.1:1616-2035(+)